MYVLSIHVGCWSKEKLMQYFFAENFIPYNSVDRYSDKKKYVKKKSFKTVSNYKKQFPTTKQPPDESNGMGKSVAWTMEYYSPHVLLAASFHNSHFFPFHSRWELWIDQN